MCLLLLLLAVLCVDKTESCPRMATELLGFCTLFPNTIMCPRSCGSCTGAFFGAASLKSENILKTLSESHRLSPMLHESHLVSKRSRSVGCVESTRVRQRN